MIITGQFCFQIQCNANSFCFHFHCYYISVKALKKSQICPHPFFFIIHHPTAVGKSTASSLKTTKHNTTRTDDKDICKSAVTYSGIVVDVLLEIFIFAEDRFGDEMIVLDADNRNQWSYINFCQPRNLLCFLVILQ